MRETSQAEAEARVRDLASLPVEIAGIGDDLKLTRQAAIYKATYRISYAGAFAAALTKETKAELIVAPALPPATAFDGG